jgi:hypothetical protein
MRAKIAKKNVTHKIRAIFFKKKGTSEQMDEYVSDAGTKPAATY